MPPAASLRDSAPAPSRLAGSPAVRAGVAPSLPLLLRLHASAATAVPSPPREAATPRLRAGATAAVRTVPFSPASPPSTLTPHRAAVPSPPWLSPGNE
ncbi:hypothetical protein DAI22_03g251900 [Oryza sativa Japonica Group]|nr:hypothetical protein DAI22_03g251900 [Oryza sativa Japonica Group]